MDFFISRQRAARVEGWKKLSLSKKTCRPLKIVVLAMIYLIRDAGLCYYVFIYLMTKNDSVISTKKDGDGLLSHIFKITIVCNISIEEKSNKLKSHLLQESKG